MYPITATDPHGVDADDEQLAVRHRLPLLISARCSSTVMNVARRIHIAACSAAAPLVMFPASELIEEDAQFVEQWTLLMHAGRGGSILITDVEEMPTGAQARFAESILQLRATQSALATRVIAGTTVSLLNQVKAGKFSQELLYRLNLIHLHRREGCDPCPECAARGRRMGI